MFAEERDLLFSALCGYLPYGVKVAVYDIFSKTVIGNIRKVDYYNRIYVNGYDFGIDIEDDISGKLQVKPYLRTMDSMSEKEKQTFLELNQGVKFGKELYTIKAYQFLNKNKFDYMG